jgi:alpha-tubulin suppressor-like RCC1 family protein
MGSDEMSAHACAIVGTTLRCWGSNDYGQLGDGSGDSSLVPKIINTGATSGAPISVAVGSKSTCALFTGGKMKCWGANDLGQLGYGISDDIPNDGGLAAPYAGPIFNSGSPEMLNHSAAGMPFLKFASAATAVVAGITQLTSGASHSCALFPNIVAGTGGTIESGLAGPRCWGSNEFGQLGNLEVGGDGVFSADPTKVINELNEDNEPVYLPGVVSIKTGGEFTCATMNKTTPPAVNGIFGCWGQNDKGQLGNGDTVDTGEPQLVMKGDVTAYELGYAHACFIRFGGMKCWGDGEGGQLGNGTVDSISRPKFVTGGRKGVSQIATGAYHTCAAFGPTNVLKCSGDNQFGSVGDGNTDMDVNPDYPIVKEMSTVAL